MPIFSAYTLTVKWTEAQIVSDDIGSERIVDAWGLEHNISTMSPS